MSDGVWARISGWLRGGEPEAPAPGTLTEISLGSDLFRAQIITEACRDQGLKVELLGTESGAHPNSTGADQRLLVRAEDIDAVRAVIADAEG